MTMTSSSGAEPTALAADIRAARKLTFGVSGLYLALYLHYGFFTFIPLWHIVGNSAFDEGAYGRTVHRLGRSTWESARFYHGNGITFGRDYSFATG
jgi:hypothetical protein